MTHFKTDDKPLILVVEDETMIRIYAAHIIAEHGYDVEDAGDAASAMEVLKARPDVRLIFTDVNMPGRLDGLGLARLVHDLRPDIRLIITSGGVMLKKADIPPGACFLGKPYRAIQLADEIHRQLSMDSVAAPPAKAA